MKPSFREENIKILPIPGQMCVNWTIEAGNLKSLPIQQHIPGNTHKHKYVL